MSNKSELFVASSASELPANFQVDSRSCLRDSLEISLVFAFILAAIWTPLGPLNSFFVFLAAACVLVFVALGRWRASQLGLTRPAAGAVPIIIVGILLCVTVAIVGVALRFAGPGHRVPLPQAIGYTVWSLVQEFILQALFFVRFEAHLGGRRAVFASAMVYALAHLPSPILTGLSLLGGIVFCELFRRWRNLYPIGLIHAALGLTIAASLPDRWMHHMRVGIGYLTMHS